MRKFEVVIDADGGAAITTVEADGFLYNSDTGFFAQRGTATFYVRNVNMVDNIAVYRGVTRVTEIKPAREGA